MDGWGPSVDFQLEAKSSKTHWKESRLEPIKSKRRTAEKLSWQKLIWKVRRMIKSSSLFLLISDKTRRDDDLKNI